VQKHPDLFNLKFIKSGNASEFVLKHHPLQHMLFEMDWTRQQLKRRTKRLRRKFLQRIGVRKTEGRLKGIGA
jgi:hypothetical protein